MKKLLITFFLVFTAINLFAQNVSYANAVQLANMTSVSDVSYTLRSWGYKLENTGSNEDYEYYEWGYGDVRYDSDISDWTYGNKTWALATLMKFSDGNIFYFNFPSSSTFEQVKSQVKANGWKISKEYQNETGFHILFEKDNVKDVVVLKELTTRAGVFSVSYYKYF